MRGDEAIQSLTAENRRLIADVLVLLHDVDVQHLGHDGRLTEHVPAAGARVCDGALVYDRRSS